jgi:hypothetical protein
MRSTPASLDLKNELRQFLRLASHFSADPKLSWLWFEIAMEEKRHAGLLQFCVAEGLWSSDLPGAGEMELLSKLFTNIERRASQSNLNLDEAFSLAIEIETSEINAIHCRLTSGLHRSTYLLKKKLATFLPNHVGKLITEAEKFGVGANLLREANRLKKTLA